MFDFRPVNSPYPGLRPFESHESEIFFGRDGHTDRLLEILQREHFLAVIGPSGCGKSSLVRAGLLPGLASGALGTGSDWRLALFRPGGEPMLALAQALLSPHALGRELQPEATPLGSPDEVTADAALLAAQLREGPDSLQQIVAAARSRQPDGAEPFNLLILVDQFEELFTYARTHDSDEGERTDFVQILLSARDASNRHTRAGGSPSCESMPANLFVAITMRTDFLGECVEFSELPEAINRSQYLTPRLKAAEMRQAIIGPALVFDGEVEAALAEHLIEASGAKDDQLPLLQHALMRFWQLDADKHLTLAEFNDLGGLQSILTGHADAVLQQLPEAQQTMAEIIFRAITERRANGQEVRRPRTLAEIAAWGGVEVKELMPVVAAFAAPEVCFLHHGRELKASSVIDLTHEALIRQWPRLQQWVADEYQRGRGYQRWLPRALEHQQGKGAWLVAGELAQALEWFEPSPLSEGEGEGWQPTAQWAGRYSSKQGEALSAEFKSVGDFIAGSRDAEEAQREAEKQQLEAEAARQRRLTRLAMVVALAALILVAASWYFKQQALDAEQHAQQAEQQRTSELFNSQLTHGSLLARVEDFAAARGVLAESERLDQAIAPERRHARNLLAGYAAMMGAQADKVYEGAEAALAGGVAVSPDGKLLAAAGERGTLVLFDAASGELMHKLQGHSDVSGENGAVFSVVFDPEGRWLFSGGNDGRIIRWALPSGEKLAEWQAPAQVYALAISPDGVTLASGGTDSDITLWQAADGTPIHTLSGHSSTIAAPNGLTFSPDGKRLASASYDNTARIWDWRSGESLLTLKGHADRVDAVAFSPDGSLLATASNDRQLIVWDAQSGKAIRHITGHQNFVFGVSFTADGSGLLSASRDNTLRLWDSASGTLRRIYQGHTAGLWDVALHGQTLYTAADDGTLRRWPLATPQQWVWEVGGSPTSIAISPNGTLVAVGMGDGSLQIYQMSSGKLLVDETDAHGRSSINRIAFSGDGRLLASAGMDGKARIWQISGDGTLHALHTLEGHSDVVHAVAFSPDGTRLATASYDGSIGLFDVTSGKGNIVPAHERAVDSVVFDGQGKQLLSAGQDGRLLLWNTDDLKQAPREIGRTQDMLLWAALSPDGRQVAAVGRDAVVQLFDTEQAAPPRPLVGHEQTVLRAIYSPDGHQLATVGADMTVRLWDLDSQSQLFSLRLPTEFQSPSPLWDFDFRCTEAGECWIAVPLTVGRVALYRLPYKHPPAQSGR